MPAGLTSTIVVNQALEAIASQTQITSLTDGSPSANAANVVYAPIVQTLLRQLEPDFARVTAVLSLSGQTSPPPPWAYEYTYPSDCARLLQVAPAAGSYNVLDPQPVRSNVAVDILYTGSITFTGVPLTTDTLTINGAEFTFINGGSPTAYELNISGETASGMAVQLWTNLNTNATLLADTRLNVAAYTQPASGSGVLPITYKFGGSGAATFSLAASSTSITLSGATLTVTPTKVILTNQASAIAAYISTTVTEAQWDAAFNQAVVARLANPLAMALAGRPDFAREVLQEAMQAGAIADGADDSVQAI